MKCVFCSEEIKKGYPFYSLWKYPGNSPNMDKNICAYLICYKCDIRFHQAILDNFGHKIIFKRDD